MCVHHGLELKVDLDSLQDDVHDAQQCDIVQLKYHVCNNPKLSKEVSCNENEYLSHHEYEEVTHDEPKRPHLQLPSIVRVMYGTVHLLVGDPIEDEGDHVKHQTYTLEQECCDAYLLPLLLAD